MGVARDGSVDANVSVGRLSVVYTHAELSLWLHLIPAPPEAPEAPEVAEVLETPAPAPSRAFKLKVLLYSFLFQLLYLYIFNPCYFLFPFLKFAICFSFLFWLTCFKV